MKDKIKEALEIIEHCQLTELEKITLINLLVSYNWMVTYGIKIESSYKAIIELFLVELSNNFPAHSKQELENIKSLLSK